MTATTAPKKKVASKKKVTKRTASKKKVSARNDPLKSLHDKALLARHIVRRKDFRTFDRKATQQVAEANGADIDKAGRFNKVLINREALATISSVVSQAYDFHVEQTLPWDDAGSRLLPADNYLEYTEGMRDYRAQFDAAVADFVSEYAKHIDEARDRLGTMFNEGEYPDASTVADFFAIETKIRPLPNADDIRAGGIDESELEKIRAQIEQDLQAVVTDAVADLWKRMHENLTTMRDRLRTYTTEEGRRFYHSWVNNVRDLVTLIAKLNFTADKKLEAMRVKVEKMLADVGNDELKESPTTAAKIANEADAILKSMAGYVGAPS